MKYNTCKVFSPGILDFYRTVIKYTLPCDSFFVSIVKIHSYRAMNSAKKFVSCSRSVSRCQWSWLEYFWSQKLYRIPLSQHKFFYATGNREEPRKVWDLNHGSCRDQGATLDSQTG